MVKPLKIVYVITGLFVGGAERLLLDTVRSLDRSRFEPVVITLIGGELAPAFERYGIRIINIRMTRFWPWPGAWRLYRSLRTEKPDLLHTHLIHSDIFGRILGRLSGVPVIISTITAVGVGQKFFNGPS